jgi:hypothetical protein
MFRAQDTSCSRVIAGGRSDPREAGAAWRPCHARRSAGPTSCQGPNSRESPTMALRSPAQRRRPGASAGRCEQSGLRVEPVVERVKSRLRPAPPGCARDQLRCRAQGARLVRRRPSRFPAEQPGDRSPRRTRSRRSSGRGWALDHLIPTSDEQSPLHSDGTAATARTRPGAVSLGGRALRGATRRASRISSVARRSGHAAMEARQIGSGRRVSLRLKPPGFPRECLAVLARGVLRGPAFSRPSGPAPDPAEGWRPRP